MSEELYRRNPARDIEALAVNVVRSWVGNLGLATDTSHGHRPDFRIDHVDGRVALGEVAWHEDPAIQAMWAETFRKERHQQIDLHPGRGQWVVGLARGANIKRLYRELGDLIDALLATDARRLTIYEHWPRGHLANTARQLCIEYLAQLEPGDPSGAVFFMPGGGGTVPTDSNAVVDWLDDLIANPDYSDTTKKLLVLPADERHVFVMSGTLTPFGADEWLRRLDQALPSRDPAVPEGITHVWVTSRFGTGPVGLWLRGTGWTSVPLPPDT